MRLFSFIRLPPSGCVPVELLQLIEKDKFEVIGEDTFLTRKRPVVLFGIKHNIHRDSVKSLTFAPTYKVDTLLAPERGRRFIIYKM